MQQKNDHINSSILGRVILTYFQQLIILTTWAPLQLDSCLLEKFKTFTLNNLSINLGLTMSDLEFSRFCVCYISLNTI